MAAFLIWIAALLDFFDGFFARLLKAYSPMGKELDSLADMVSFGVLPAMILFVLIENSTESLFLPYLALLVAAFSALRLANFNIDTRQTENFIGLPTPANAIFISSFPFIISEENNFLNHLLLNEWFLVSIAIVFSLLLVAELPLFSLKFKSYKWSENKIRFSFIILSVILLVFLQFIAIPIIIVVYIIISLIQTYTLKRNLKQNLTSCH